MSDYKLVPAEIIDRFPEINPSNYGHDDACSLNAWGVELVLAAVDAPAVQGEPVAGEVTLFECVDCNYLYQSQVSRCDCMPAEQKFNRWLARPERPPQKRGGG